MPSVEKTTSNTKLIRHFEEAINNVCNVLFSLDVNGKLITWHKFAEEFFGHTKKKAIGQHINNLWPEKGQSFTNAIHKGKAEQRFEIIPSSGSTAKSQILTTVPIKDLNNKVIAVTCVSNGITYSNKFLQSILDGIDDAIKIVDKDFNIIMLNKAAVERTTNSESQLMGGKCYVEFWDKNAPCSYCTTWNCFDTNRPHQSMATYEISGGKQYLEFSTFPIKDDTGRTIYVIEFERDITERKNLELEREEQRKELDKKVQEIQKAYSEVQSIHNQLLQSEKLASIGQITSSLAHELDSPLTTISGYCELLEEDINDQKALSRLKIISDQVLRCQKTIREVLDFSRKSQGIKTLQDINTLIKRTVSLMEHTIKANKAQIKLDLNDKVPQISVDENQVQQVFFNLLRNAIDAMPDGGKIIISSAFNKGPNSLKISFEDTGQGISKENMDCIFMPFFTTKLPGKGTGLGLNICSDIIKNHGGNITAKNKKGKGAVFIINLPVT